MRYHQPTTNCRPAVQIHRAVLNFIENIDLDEESSPSDRIENIWSKVGEKTKVAALTELLQLGQPFIHASPQLRPFGKLVLSAGLEQLFLVLEDLRLESLLLCDRRRVEYAYMKCVGLVKWWRSESIQVAKSATTQRRRTNSSSTDLPIQEMSSVKNTSAKIVERRAMMYHQSIQVMFKRPKKMLCPKPDQAGVLFVVVDGRCEAPRHVGTGACVVFALVRI